MNVELDLDDFVACGDAALRRMRNAGDKSANHANVRNRTFMTRLRDEIIGAAGELAVCKSLGIEWDATVNDGPKQPDIAPDIEVRATNTEGGCLVFRKHDPEDRWYFLVTGYPPSMKVIGFVRGSDAKDSRWERNPNGHGSAYFVPQTALHSVAQWQSEHRSVNV